MSLTEKKAGGAAVDPDDYNEVVDAVVALQASSVVPQPFIYTGEGPIDPTGTLFVLQETVPSTSGTFTLTFSGETTAPITFDATAQDIVDALGVLDSVAFQVAAAAGYENAVLNEGQVRITFTGTLQGPTDAPTVTNDTTDNGVEVALSQPGEVGDPALPDASSLYVLIGTPPLLYVFDGSVWRTTGVGANAITDAELDNGSVTNAKIAGAAVDSGKIANSTITDTNIADGAVTGPKMGTPVSYLNPATATVSQLITVMIASNVMAPS